MTVWKKIPPKDGDDIVNVIVEISKGSMNKYEIDKETGMLVLDRVLYSAMHYPLDYGFIPRTYCDDGDPLDVFIVSTEPLLPGSLVKVRVVGGFEMIDDGEKDDKLIGVVSDDPRFNHINDLDELGEHLQKEIKHFFEHYKDLQGKEVKVKSFLNKEEALKILDESIDLFKREFE